MILSVLVGINVYFLGLRGGTSIGALLRTTRVRSMPSGTPGATGAAPAAKVPLAPLPEDPAGGHVVDGMLTDGQTIAQALTAVVGKRTAAQIEGALSERLELASVHAGQTYSLLFDVEERLVAFEFRADKMLAHRVTMTGQKMVVSSLAGKADTRVVELALPAGPGLWEAVRRAGETSVLAERLVELFAAEGDLVTAASNEKLRVLVEKRLVGGRFVRYGRIVAAEWVTRAGVRRAFSYAGEMYTERGEAVGRSYLAMPLRPSRVAAPGRRSVQTLADGRVVVEQPTAAGAMAWAVAAGTITALARTANGGTLTLEVARGERVQYARLGKLARGIALGVEVPQGRALARVEGMLTVTYEGKPELHDGRSVPPRLAALSVAERPRFGETIAPLLERLRTLALRERDPLAARGLSAIP